MQIILTLRNPNAIVKITSALLNQLCYGGFAIQERVNNLYQGGHILVHSIRNTECMYGSGISGTKVWVIRFVVVASQKTRMYNVTLGFHHDTKEFLTTPCSSCECPAGSLMCSHIIYSIPIDGLDDEEYQRCSIRSYEMFTTMYHSFTASKYTFGSFSFKSLIILNN